MPIFGSFLQIGKIAKNAVNHPIVDFCEEYYYKDQKVVPPFVGLTGPEGVALAVARPSVVAELFLTKNKYFDKHPKTARELKRMTGDSILFEPSSLRWQQKRKALSSALYKDKLKDMIELMKQVTISTIQGRWSNAEGSEIDIVKEASNLFIKITIVCMFGSECADLKLKQRVNGNDVWMSLGEVIIQQMEQSNLRMFHLHNILIPEFKPYYYSPSDRRLAHN